MKKTNKKTKNKRKTKKRLMESKKERPRCRKKIEKILADGNITLEGLADGYMPVGNAKMVVVRSRGIMLQARKMLKEQR